MFGPTTGDRVRLADTELWIQVEGDLTRRLDGAYTLEPAGDDTEVVYRLTVELKVPLPGFVKRRAEGRIMGAALKDLKARAEA